MSQTPKGPFKHLLIKMEGNEPIPFKPFVEIVLAFTFTASDDSGPSLSGNLMTEGEIDNRIHSCPKQIMTLGHSQV